MLRRKGKLKDLKRQAEEAEARVRANLEQLNALAEEWRELCAEEKNPLPGARLLEIARRKAAILAEETELRAQGEELGRKSQWAQHLYNNALRRLEAARHTLRVIDRPPSWGLGDYSPHQIRIFKQQAEQTIRELG